MLPAPRPMSHIATASPDMIAAQIISGLGHCKSIDEIAQDIAAMLAQEPASDPVCAAKCSGGLCTGRADVGFDQGT